MNPLSKITKRGNASTPSAIELLNVEKSAQGSDAAIFKKKEEAKQGAQVEPKTYFANERTFIQWISAALLLLTVSSVLVGSGNYNTTSSVIAFSAFVLVSYASWTYFRRVKLLKTGQPYGYLDFVGPAILAIGVGFGIFIVFADAVKGSEFLGSSSSSSNSNKNSGSSMWYRGDDDDDRRVLLSNKENKPLFEGVSSKECYSAPIQGINLLEYQPKDVALTNTRNKSFLLASSQSLVSMIDHDGRYHAETLSSLLDVELAAVATFNDGSSSSINDDRIFMLSTGPSKVELIELASRSNTDSEHSMHEKNRWTLDDKPSVAGAMTYAADSHRLYISLDRGLYAYQVHQDADQNKNTKDMPPTLSRVQSINRKVLNHGLMESDSLLRIDGMEYLDGMLYLLYGDLNIVRAWNMDMSTLVGEVSLPMMVSSARDSEDRWVGLALERRNDVAQPSLRGNASENHEGLYIHLSLDAYPPQLWSFQLEESHGGLFAFPECSGVSSGFPF